MHKNEDNPEDGGSMIGDILDLHLEFLAACSYKEAQLALFFSKGMRNDC